MKLNYVVISQAITGVLAYKLGFAVVSLTDNRVALVAPEVLTVAQLNPALGDSAVPLHVKISAMREGLVGQHAVLRRQGKDLLVSRLSATPVATLKIDPAQVADMCAHVTNGGAVSGEMKVLANALRLSRNPSIRPLFEQFKQALDAARKRPLVDLRSKFQLSMVPQFV